MGTTEITANPGEQQIMITREFAATPELLFRAYTEPELLAQWIGPRELNTKIDHLDVRNGGTWRYVQTNDEGNEFGFHGVYHGEPSLDGVVQTFEFEGVPGHVALETLRFEPRGDSTLVRTIAVYQSVQDRDAMVASGMERGVRDSMDRLAELLERIS